MTMPISIPTWVGIIFASVAAVESNSVGLVEKNSYCCCSRKETRKLQLVIMSSFELRELFDVSKAISKTNYIKISYKQRTRF